MNRNNGLLALGLALSALTVGANDSAPPENPQISLELLEFLGDWEDESGAWLDPNTLLEVQSDEIPVSGEEGQAND